MNINVKQASTKELVEIYNKLSNSNIKKFENREKAEQRVEKLIAEKAPATPKTARRRSFRFAAITDLNKTPRSGTARAKAFELMSRPEGILMSELSAQVGWKDAALYEGIRLVHFTTGCAMWHELEGDDYRLFVLADPKEYVSRLTQFKQASVK